MGWTVIPTHNFVAIKVLVPTTDEPFDQESPEVAALAHVQIHQKACLNNGSATTMSILGVWKDGHSIFLIMPYCESRLSDIWKKRGRLAESDARCWFKQIIEVCNDQAKYEFLSFHQLLTLFFSVACRVFQCCNAPDFVTATFRSIPS